MEEPQSTSVELVDMLEHVLDKDMELRIEAANEDILENAYDEEVLAERTKFYEEEFADTGLHQYHQLWSVVVGFAFMTNERGTLNGRRKFIDRDDILFNKVTVAMVNGFPQIALEFQDESTVDSEGSEQEGRLYYFLPRTLAKFEVQPEEEFEDTTKRITFQSKSFTSDPEFIKAEISEQKELLNGICLGAEDDLNIDDDTELKIEAVRFVIDLEDSDMPLQDCMFDQAEISEEDRLVPEGIYMGVMYPEASDRQHRFKSPKDFFIGQGVPSIVLHDKSKKLKYYIPFDTIENVMFTNEIVPVDDDDDGVW